MTLALACLASLIAAAASAQPAPPKPFSNTMEGAYGETSGNTDTKTLRGSNTLTLFREPYALTLRASAYFTKFQNATAAEWYSGDGRVDRRLGERFYVYTLGGWERNRFAGVENRAQGNAGPGALLLYTRRQSLRLEPGLGHFNEERTDRSTVNALQGRASLDYQATLTESSRFRQELEGYYNIDHPRDHRARLASTLYMAFNKTLGVQWSYTYLYRGAPIPGFRRVDRILSTGLYASFSP